MDTCQAQFDEVKDKEIADIYSACGEATGLNPRRIELVFIVCQMRTRARFRLLTDQELQQQQPSGGGSGRNVEYGTVVDTDITGADEDIDWYMVPHKALKGTSRPSHYHVLQVEVEIAVDF